MLYPSGTPYDCVGYTPGPVELPTGLPGVEDEPPYPPGPDHVELLLTGLPGVELEPYPVLELLTGLPGVDDEPQPVLELLTGLPGVELVPGYVVEPQDSPGAVVVE